MASSFGDGGGRRAGSGAAGQLCAVAALGVGAAAAVAGGGVTTGAAVDATAPWEGKKAGERGGDEG